MNRIRAYTMLLLAELSAISTVLAPSSAQARDTARRPVSTNEITGLELGLEGAETVVRGAPLRWFFTLYEVVGRDRLRPAHSGRLRVLTSFKPDKAIAELITDDKGRAAVEIPVPEDASNFDVAIEAASGRVSRNFSMFIATAAPGKIELVADRKKVQPGETVSFVGRVVSLPSGRPAAGRSINISITDQDGRAVQTEGTIKTSPTGAFIVQAVAPSKAGEIHCTASVKAIGSTSVAVSIERRKAPRMVVRAAPKQLLVAPGKEVPVDVVVRRGDGRPVAGAVVRLTKEAPAPSAKDIKTDQYGRAVLKWKAPKVLGNEIEDVTVNVWADRAGLEEASTELTVRVARAPFQIGVSVEGGSLLPGLPSRVFVRVTRADGTFARKTRVRINGPMVGALTGRTDNEGVAVLDVRPMAEPGIAGLDRCGGATSSSVAITVGDDQKDPQSEHCIPIDPDGTVRVRPSRPVITAGESLSLKIFTTRDAAPYPVEIALLQVDDSSPTLIPAARQIVEATSATRQASVRLPKDLTGEVLIRARPLVGPSFEPARGGTALIWVTPGKDIVASVNANGTGIARISIFEPQDGVDGTVLIVPAEESFDFMVRLREKMIPGFARLLGDQPNTSGSLIEGRLAAHTPRDDAAPTVIRGKTTVAMPATKNPPSSGVLRDPIRARARFIRGRLALVVKTLESRLEEAIPDRINDIGTLTPGGFRFNREALSAVKGYSLLESQDPTTLGGEPLTLEDLERMDPSFTFDNMARRVTRKRLLAVLVRLRDFVRNRELDLRQPGGDPGPWLDLLAEEYDDEGNEPEPRSLYDGWGRRMAIRRAPDGRTRFSFLAPLPPGFELVSAGPDDRFGTSDDMVDPFARVLPSGSAYAEAVGEDALLIRLSHIEISRALIDAVVGLFDDSAGEYSGESSENLDAAGAWDAQPSPLAEMDSALRFERNWRPIKRSTARLGKIGAALSVPFKVDDEPRKWSLVAAAWTHEGRATFARYDFRSGFPVVLDSEAIRRLTSDEPLILPVAGAGLPDGPQDLVLSVTAKGAVRAELETGGTESPLSIGPGGGFEARIRLVGKGEGQGAVNVVVRDPSGPGLRAINLPIDVRRQGLLMRQSASAAVLGKTELMLDIPRDANPKQSELVLTSPDALKDDPMLLGWFDKDPALITWALTVSGQPIPDDLLSRLEAATKRTGEATGDIPALSTACAAVAWAAVAKTGATWAQDATAGAVHREDAGDDLKKLSIDAAILAALSIATAPGDESPLAKTIESIRTDLRAAGRRYRDDPAFLARGAAALLLADSRDIRGQTMLALALPHLVKGFRGGRAVDVSPSGDEDRDGPSRRDGAEQLTATAALAVAAHQVGDKELADDLALGLAAGANIATKLGGEPLFWFLAARAFGVFGMIGNGKPVAVTVSQDHGAPRRIELGGKAVAVPIEEPGPGDSALFRIEPKEETGILLLVSTSATYVRPARQQKRGPLTAELKGDVGFAGERAAYIATVSNTSPSVVERPVLFVELPAGAELDDAAKDAISRTANVITVDYPDLRGIVRVRFTPLSPGQSLSLPIPLRWSAAGRRTGLSLIVFPEDKNWELTISPPRKIDVPFRPEPQF